LCSYWESVKLEITLWLMHKEEDFCFGGSL
jgi:hypothetical protein